MKSDNDPRPTRDELIKLTAQARFMTAVLNYYESQPNEQAWLLVSDAKQDLRETADDIWERYLQG